jgi:hypothetical protein
MKGKQPMLQIEIRIKGHINPQWSEWFGGLTIRHSDPDETLIAGLVPDQAALYGIISHLRDLGLKLTSVSSEEVQENFYEHNR